MITTDHTTAEHPKTVLAFPPLHRLVLPPLHRLADTALAGDEFIDCETADKSRGHRVGNSNSRSKITIMTPHKGTLYSLPHICIWYVCETKTQAKEMVLWQAMH